MRWITGDTVSRAVPETDIGPAPTDSSSVHETLLRLPTLLEGSNLPNGVVELLIEDLEASTHRLFDIHDGHITLVEPGKCVPWASIAGPHDAWAMALGPERDSTALKLSGDEQLARRVLAAMPRRD